MYKSLKINNGYIDIVMRNKGTSKDLVATLLRSEYDKVTSMYQKNKKFKNLVSNVGMLKQNRRNRARLASDQEKAEQSWPDEHDIEEFIELQLTEEICEKFILGLKEIYTVEIDYEESEDKQNRQDFSEDKVPEIKQMEQNVDNNQWNQELWK